MNESHVTLHFWFGDFPSAREIDLEVVLSDDLVPEKAVVIYCDAAIPACTLNKSGEKYVCNSCMARTRFHRNLIKKSIEFVPLSTFINIDMVDQVRGKLAGEITSDYLNELDKPIQGIGRGVLSSAISFTRDMNLVEPATLDLVVKLLSTSIIVSHAVIAAISKHDPLSIVVHNGRLAEYHAVFLTGRHRGVDVFTHEACSPKPGWYLFKNGRIHDRDHFAELVRESTDGIPTSELASKAEEYLYSKRHGTAWFENYTKYQEAGLRLYKKHDDQKIVSIFTSSEDEFASIGPEWKMPYFDSQFSAIRHIIDDCHAVDPSIFFIVRMHPNMAKMHPNDLEPYFRLTGENIHLVTFDSKVDSYAVLDDSDVVVTFGSTIGMEATFWGKPTVQVGHSLFESFDIVYLPESRDAITQLLLSPPVSRCKSTVYKYVYTICAGGFKYRFAKKDYIPTRIFDVAMLIPSFGLLDKVVGVIASPNWARFIYSIRRLIKT